MALAFLAGYVDAYGLGTFGTFVSFMSGNTTHAGDALGAGAPSSAAKPALAIGAFFAGSLVGSWVGGSRRRGTQRLMFAAIAALLGAAFGATLLASSSARQALALVALGLAMGLVKPALQRAGGAHVSPTYVTGTLTRLAQHLAGALRRAPLQDARGPGDSHLRRSMLLGSVWCGFFVGAVLSAAARPLLGHRELLAAAIAFLVLALVSRP